MYLTYDEYAGITKNPVVTVEDFTSYEVYAEAVVDSFTFGVIGRKNLLSEGCYKGTVQTAMAYQIDFMAKGGLDGYADENGKKIASRSVNVGGTSESVSYSNDTVEPMTGTGMKVAPVAAALLAPIKAMGRFIG